MTDKFWLYLWIGLGSALGGMGRFWISGWATQRFDTQMPVGTLIVNVAGSFVIGVLAAFTLAEGRYVLASKAAPFLMIGVCGGFTTFSAFSLQTLALLREGQWHFAAWNALLSILLCLAAVWMGLLLGQWMNKT
jgi:CrcB protein